MAEFPGFTLWTDAYLGDTGHLTTLEHGAYLLLLIAMWRSGGSLPADDAKLAKFCHLTVAQWGRIKLTIMDFMTIVDGRITQSRLTDELAFVRRRSARQSENARAKSRKTKGSIAATAKPNASQINAPTLTPTLTEDTSLRSVAPSAPKPSEQMVELRKVLDEEHAKAVIDHRKGFKGRFTARAAILLASKFGRCPDANAAADAMISNNWMGFEPEWLENRKASARASPAVPLRGLAAIEERLKRDIENEQRINSTPSPDGEIDAGFPFLAIADHRGHY